MYLLKCSVELPLILALMNINQNVKTYLSVYCLIDADPLTYLPVEVFLNEPWDLWIGDMLNIEHNKALYLIGACGSMYFTLAFCTLTVVFSLIYNNLKQRTILVFIYVKPLCWRIGGSVLQYAFTCSVIPFSCKTT